MNLMVRLTLVAESHDCIWVIGDKSLIESGIALLAGWRQLLDHLSDDRGALISLSRRNTALPVSATVQGGRSIVAMVEPATSAAPGDQMRLLAGEVADPVASYRELPAWKERAAAALRISFGERSTWVGRFDVATRDLALPAPALAESWDVFEFEEGVRKAAALLVGAAAELDGSPAPARRIAPDRLRQEIAESLAQHVKAYDLAEVCVTLGLAPCGEHEDPSRSKRVYAKQRLIGINGNALLKVGRAVVEDYDDPELEALVEQFNMQLNAQNTPGAAGSAERLAELTDWPAVQRAWTASSEKLLTDPEGAITAARTMLESVCKHICDERGAAYESGWDLAKLYKAAAASMDIAPDQHTEQVIKQILSGVSSIVGGLAALRNSMSDAHGKGKRSVRPAVRHAKLAVNAAYTVAGFLIDTHAEKAKVNAAS